MVGTQLRVAMLVRIADVRIDNRVRREAETVARLGHRVTVLVDSTRELPASTDRIVWERVQRRPRSRSALRHGRRPARALARLLEAAPSPLRSRRLRPVRFWRDVAPQLRELQPHVVHAHDLKTLYAGARYAHGAGVPLVYDAHELELYSMAIRSRTDRAVAWLFERYGIRRADAVITVGDAIAAELVRIHGVPPPTVLLNTPSIATAPSAPSTTLRELCGVGADARLLAYVGGLNAGRGVDELVAALDLLPESFHLAVVGPHALHATGGRLHSIAPVPGHEVPSLLSGADVAVVPIAPTCRSYELSMPNKLFEGMMAGVPLAVSARQELAAFVRAHRLGTVFDEDDPASIAAAVTAVLGSPPDGIGDRATQEAFSWEAQEPKLAALYAGLLS